MIFGVEVKEGEEGKGEEEGRRHVGVRRPMLPDIDADLADRASEEGSLKEPPRITLKGPWGEGSTRYVHPSPVHSQVFPLMS